jgi:hypothetical protein
VRLRGSRRRLRRLEADHRGEWRWILLTLLVLEGLAALMWVLASA